MTSRSRTSSSFIAATDNDDDAPPRPPTTKVVLVIDTGSSSTRCSAWELVHVPAGSKADVEDGTASQSKTTPSFVVKPFLLPPPNDTKNSIDGDDDFNSRGDHHQDELSSNVSVRHVRALHPTTGRIRSVSNLLHAVDQVVDDTLDRLRHLRRPSASPSLSSSQSLQEPSTSTTFPAFEVVGVGFTSFVMNLVGVDEHGVPVDDELATLSYACNAPEVANQVRILKRQLKEETRLQHLYETTGAPLHASYALPQLRNLYRHHPDIAARIVHWQTIASCCLSRWLGVSHLPISYSEASWTGLIDYKTCQYASCLRNLLPDECWTSLPELCDYDDLSRRGLPEHSPYYDRWPELRHSTHFVLGIGDGACATIGSKCTTLNRIACTIGTSAAARICVKLPILSSLKVHSDVDAAATGSTTSTDAFVPGLFCYRVDKNRVVVGGALTDGGSVVEWARRLLNLESSHEAYESCMTEVEERINQELAAGAGHASSSSGSVSFIPFLSGERFTGFRERASGCLFGMRGATRPSHVLQSCLEGVTLRLYAIVLLLLKARSMSLESRQDSTSEDDNVVLVASGGALEKNKLWRQMLADCTGLQVVLDEDSRESTSRGVALLVAQALQRAASTTAALDGCTSASLVEDEPLTPVLVSNPRPELSKYWNQRAAEQDRLLVALSPLYYHNDSE